MGLPASYVHGCPQQLATGTDDVRWEAGQLGTVLSRRSWQIFTKKPESHGGRLQPLSPSLEDGAGPLSVYLGLCSRCGSWQVSRSLGRAPSRKRKGCGEGSKDWKGSQAHQALDSSTEPILLVTSGESLASPGPQVPHLKVVTVFKCCYYVGKLKPR